MSEIKDWSTTAASNNSAAPDGAPEGMLPSAVNNTIREIMAQVRTWFEDSIWVNLGYTCTRASDTTFTIAADVTSTFAAGRRLKIADVSTLYGTITTSTYSAPNTTVTVVLDSGTLSTSMNGETVSISALVELAIPEVQNTLTVDGDVSVGGNVSVGGTMSVTGASSFSGNATLNTAGNDLILDKQEGTATDRTTISWHDNGTQVWFILHQADGDISFERASGTGRVRFNDVGISFQTASIVVGSSNTRADNSSVIYFNQLNGTTQDGYVGHSSGNDGIQMFNTTTLERFTLLDAGGIETNANILPVTDSTYYLGSNLFRWAYAYVDDVVVTTSLTIGGNAALDAGDLGVTVQAYDANTAKTDEAANFTAGLQSGGNTVLTSADNVGDDNPVFCTNANGAPCIATTELDVDTAVTEATWTEINSTNWTDLSNVPSTADWVELRFYVEALHTTLTAGDIAYLQIYARDDGGTQAVSPDTMIVRCTGVAQTGGDVRIGTVATHKVPVTYSSGSSRFELYWSDNNISARDIKMYLVGYGSNG